MERNTPLPHDFSQLLQNLRDLEIELTTAIEHGDAIEQQMEALNQHLLSEIRQRETAERRLRAVLDLVNEQKSDLEILVQALAEHGDEIDQRWMARYDDIEQLTRQDGLTQIGNRREFDDYLNQALMNCRDAHQPLSLIFCDIDHFKAYNDTYGHWEGDAALIKVAQAMQAVCQREADKPMRYGGEEFAIILPNTDLAGAEQIAQSLKAAILAKQIPHNASSFKVLTLSIGVICVSPDSQMSAQAMVEQVDAHLYTAKKRGRNQIISSLGIVRP
jgi:diguanylate cyclase (GGDEF)-like protein